MSNESIRLFRWPVRQVADRFMTLRTSTDRGVLIFFFPWLCVQPYFSAR